jgi:predicted adenylyl cyclase CyaB
MNEVELKFLEIDVDAIVAKLDKLGAKKVFDGDMHACYLDAADGAIKRENKVLRIRTQGEKVVLAYKEKNKSEFASSSTETEIDVSDYGTTKSIFLKLGYVVTKEYSKHRASYKLPGFSFEFDTINGIPTFLELEATSEDDIKKACLMLDLDVSKGVDWNCFKVQDHYKK